jgi:transposase-like protein
MNRSAEKVAFWKFVLAEHAESGLNISAFCRREGVSQASFYQWRKKLAGGAVEPPSATHLPTPHFVPVEITSANDASALSDQAVAKHAATLTIRTPDGYAVDISASTPANLIERSLRVLGQFRSEQAS